MSIQQDMPARNDKDDHRCAFTTMGCEDGALLEPVEDSWCYGCGFYICESCHKNSSVFGTHDVTEHLDEPDEDC